MDRRLGFNEIPILLSKLERNSTIQRFNAVKCAKYLKVGSFSVLDRSTSYFYQLNSKPFTIEISISKPLTGRQVYSNLCSRLQDLSSLIKTTDGFILGEHEPHSMAEKRLQSGQIVNLFGGIEVRI